MEQNPERGWLPPLAWVLCLLLTSLCVAQVGGSDIPPAAGTGQWRTASNRAAEPTPLHDPWIDRLAVIGPLTLLASVLCATFAGFRTTRQRCIHTLWAALGFFLAFIVSLTANSVLAHRAVDLAASPGLLPQADQAATVISFDQPPPAWHQQPPPPLTNVPPPPPTIVPAITPPVDMGPQAPDFTLTTVDGQPVCLSGQRGRMVLINFFATWCGPCQQELPELERIWQEFRDQDGFAMLVIGRQESAETLQAFRAQRGFTFPLAADPNRMAFDGFAGQGIPRTYLISRDGRILRECVGYRPQEILELTNLLRSELARGQ